MNIGLENVDAADLAERNRHAANRCKCRDGGQLVDQWRNIDIAYASFFTGEDSLGSGVYYLRFRMRICWLLQRSNLLRFCTTTISGLSPSSIPMTGTVGVLL